MLNEKHEPVNYNEFEKALEVILASNEPLDQPSKAWLAHRLHEAKISEELSMKCQIVSQKIFGHETPIFFTLGNKKYVSLSPNIFRDCINFRKFIKSISPSKIDLETLEKEDINLDELIDSEIFVESNGFRGDTVPVDQKELEILLRYLENGKITIRNNNVFRLINLAKRFRIESLKKECANFFKGKITQTNIVLIWRACTNFPVVSEIISLLSEFIQKNPSIRISSDDQTLNKFIIRIRQAQSSGIHFKDGFICLKLPEESTTKTFDTLTNSLKYMSNSLEELNKDLKELIPNLEINLLSTYSIDLKTTSQVDLSALARFLESRPEITGIGLGEASDITEDEIDVLVSHMRHMDYFAIDKNSKIKSLPDEISRRVKVLRCQHCTALVKVSAWKAKEITFFNIPNLREFDAPEVEKFDASHLPNLSTLTLLKAKMINLYAFDKLTKVNVPEVEIFIACGLDLSELTLLKGKYIKLDHINGLIKADFPEVETFIGKHLLGLQTLIIPKANWVEIENSIDIEEINAPKAERFIGKYLKKLQILILRKAKEVTLENLDIIEEINISEFTTLNAERCPKLYRRAHVCT